MAKRAAGMVPARMRVMFIERRPWRMRSPRPPEPMRLVVVTMPMVQVEAMRKPFIMCGMARGSSTQRRS